MRKIIHGKKYDTDTANQVCDPTSPVGMYDVSDFHYYEETLYRKKTGEYFLYGWGGPLSPYSEPYGQRGSQGGERISPLTLEQAREWAERHLTAEEYEAEFGPVPEGEEGAVVSARVSAAAKRALEREAQRTGESQTAILERLLLSLREG